MAVFRFCSPLTVLTSVFNDRCIVSERDALLLFTTRPGIPCVNSHRLADASTLENCENKKSINRGAV